jgi:hypothetical protein
VSFKAVSGQRGSKAFVLAADERAITKNKGISLWGTSILKAVLDQSGIAIHLLQPSGTIRESLGGGTDIGRNEVTKSILSLVPENVYHAVNSTSCVFVERRKTGVFLIVNLLAPSLRGVGESVVEGSSSSVRRRLIRTLLLVAGLKLNQAIQELREIIRMVD